MAEPRPPPKSRPTPKLKANAKRIHDSRPDGSDAESSTTAAKRARMTHPQLKPTYTPVGIAKLYKGVKDVQANIVTGKRARKQIQLLDFEDAENSDEDGYRPASGSTSKSKSGTGSSGKQRGKPPTVV